MWVHFEASDIKIVTAEVSNELLICANIQIKSDRLVIRQTNQPSRKQCQSISNDREDNSRNRKSITNSASSQTSSQQQNIR